VVPRASAVVPGAADAEPIVLYADHINMVKSESKEDSRYKTVSGYMQIMVHDTSGRISSRWEEKDRINAGMQLNVK
jgi:hypothetical protein